MQRTSNIDPAVCEKARLSRDARFDGLFFTAVRSTGIYCRPVCPAPVPHARHVSYYATAAAASAAGYRPCLRCRPELAPGAPAWRSGSDMVAAALRLIDDGLLDRAGVAALAARIGVGERHLRRLFTSRLGASPLQVAATRRLLFARQLMGATALPVTDVALASGYASVRRFNAAFRDIYGMAPRDMRRGRPKTPAREAAVPGIELYLPFRAPYDFESMLVFLARRALPGAEEVRAGTYRRMFMHDGVAGRWSLCRAQDRDALLLRVCHPQVRGLGDVVARVRRMFDLDADAAAIAVGLGRARILRPLLRRFPGLRVPGAWDGFEVAVRAVLGQQVSVAAARTMAVRIVERWGERMELQGETLALFPAPDVLADADLTTIGMPPKRAATVNILARAVHDGELGFHAGQGLEAFIAAWTALPGIGDWTAHYIAMRCLSHPDAFPAADLILRRAMGADAPMKTRELEHHSQAWRPWRAYATLLLWRSQSG